MPASTTRGAVRYPLGTDPPDTDGDMRKIAEDVADRFVIFDESATRPAAGTRGRLHRNPATGEVTWDTGTAWEALDVGKLGGKSAPLYLLTSDANAAYVAKTGSTMTGTLALDQGLFSGLMRGLDVVVGAAETTTSTAYVNLATIGPIATFTAPPSGRVKVTVQAAVSNSGAGGVCLIAPRVEASPSAATFLAAADNNSAQSTSSTAGAYNTIGASRMVDGLTAGALYSAAVQYRVTGGTGTFVYRRVIVEPQP